MNPTSAPYDDAAPYADDVDEPGPVDPYAIEPVALPSGVKVEFRSMAALTADNMRWLRGADDREGSMAFYNEVQARALHLLVESWTLTEANGRPVMVPRMNRQDPRAYLRILSGIDSLALERHLRAPLERLLGPGGRDAAGE